MRVSIQNSLQPSEHQAHGVIIFDDLGNPIFVAMQLSESIIYADAGEKDFAAMCKAMGCDKTVVVDELRPKPVENVIWTP